MIQSREGTVSWEDYRPGRENGMSKNSDSRNSVTSSENRNCWVRRTSGTRWGQVIKDLERHAKTLGLYPVKYRKPSKGFKRRMWLDSTLV